MWIRRPFDYAVVGRRSPFEQLERMRRQMDRLVDAWNSSSGTGETAGVFPLINLTEDADHYYVRAELPGVGIGAIDLSVTGTNLSISGERTIPSEGENVKYHRREREAGRFSRIIGLPGAVNAEQVSASLVNGVLAVTVPKAEAAKPRRIVIS